MEMKCFRCGHSCTLRVKLSLFDYLRVLLTGARKFSEKNLSGKRFLKQVDGKCTFLTEKDGKPHCKIYSNRPKMCRRFPGVAVCPYGKALSEGKPLPDDFGFSKA